MWTPHVLQNLKTMKENRGHFWIQHPRKHNIYQKYPIFIYRSLLFLCLLKAAFQIYFYGLWFLSQFGKPAAKPFIITSFYFFGQFQHQMFLIPSSPSNLLIQVSHFPFSKSGFLVTSAHIILTLVLCKLRLHDGQNVELSDHIFIIFHFSSSPMCIIFNAWRSWWNRLRWSSFLAPWWLGIAEMLVWLHVWLCQRACKLSFVM